MYFGPPQEVVLSYTCGRCMVYAIAHSVSFRRNSINVCDFEPQRTRSGLNFLQHFSYIIQEALFYRLPVFSWRPVALVPIRVTTSLQRFRVLINRCGSRPVSISLCILQSDLPSPSSKTDSLWIPACIKFPAEPKLVDLLNKRENLSSRCSESILAAERMIQARFWSAFRFYTYRSSLSQRKRQKSIFFSCPDAFQFSSPIVYSLRAPTNIWGSLVAGLKHKGGWDASTAQSLPRK